MLRKFVYVQSERRQAPTTWRLGSGICSGTIRKWIERETSRVYALGWLRGVDLNQRPSGYERVGQKLHLVCLVSLPKAPAHLFGFYLYPILYPSTNRVRLRRPRDELWNSDDYLGRVLDGTRSSRYRDGVIQRRRCQLVAASSSASSLQSDKSEQKAAQQPELASSLLRPNRRQAKSD